MSLVESMMRRIGALEERFKEVQDALTSANQNNEKLREQMEEAAKAQYALQIATMLAMLRMAGVDEAKIDKDLRSYLHMGRIYAKSFMAEKEEEMKDEQQ